jgi:hypothetical protein
MSRPKKSTIEVQGTAITIIAQEHGDYISLTDMVRNFEGGGALIEQWLKNKDTVLFLGVWERINNPDFNSLEFEGIRNEAGRNSFFLSAKAWAERTRAKGLIASAGRYGGTVAGNARRELEKKSGRKVVTSENYLALTQSAKKLSNKAPRKKS